MHRKQGKNAKRVQKPKIRVHANMNTGTKVHKDPTKYNRKKKHKEQWYENPEN